VLSSAALMPEPKAAASAPSQDAGSTWSPTLPGLVRILTIPGFEIAPIAVAKMSDGTYLVLGHQRDCATRRIGIYRSKRCFRQVL
jgi:hypothetical protein